MMNTLRAKSRSVASNIFEEKVKEKQMKLHLLKLKEIKTQQRTEIKNTEHKSHKKLLKKNKSASNKIDQLFNPVSVENKSLVSHLTDIKRRKSEHGLSMRQLLSHRSVKEEEHKEIQKENKKLIMAILEQKSKITSRKNLKKQFKHYEEQKSMLRKVKSKNNF